MLGVAAAPAADGAKGRADGATAADDDTAYDDLSPAKGRSPRVSAAGGAPSVRAASLSSSAGAALRRHQLNVLLGDIISARARALARLGPLSRLLVSVVESVATIALLTVAGTLVFSRLERGRETASDARLAALLAEVQAGVSAETYETLLRHYIPHPPGADLWALNQQSSYLFSFTVITSIGYGVFCPRTPGGQIFFCVYALVRAPT
jgi:hypothetical protein